MVIVGIDPGIKGGIAGLDFDRKLLWAIEMPVVKNPQNDKSEYDITRIADLLRAAKPDLVCLERVHSMPGQGVSSTFLFGKGFGILLGVIGTLGIPLRMVAPQTWKAKLQITADKETARNLANSTFPDCAHFWKLKKHDGLAEAALLALFASDSNDLDGVVPGDISELYHIEANIHVRASSRTGRHHNRSPSKKSNRARDSARKRGDFSPGRSHPE